MHNFDAYVCLPFRERMWFFQMYYLADDEDVLVGAGDFHPCVQSARPVGEETQFWPPVRRRRGGRGGQGPGRGGRHGRGRGAVARRDAAHEAGEVEDAAVAEDSASEAEASGGEDSSSSTESAASERPDEVLVPADLQAGVWFSEQEDCQYISCFVAH